ncbi:Tubulinyl-Tyr carboxypeptidase 2, partial [Rhizoclosmatium hyalinum]
LAVKHKGKVGALGLSRRVDLMDKPVQFDTIEALVQEYRECYAKNGHVVVKVKVGGLVPRDPGAKVEAFPWPQNEEFYQKHLYVIGSAFDGAAGSFGVISAFLFFANINLP